MGPLSSGMASSPDPYLNCICKDSVQMRPHSQALGGHIFRGGTIDPGHVVSPGTLPCSLTFFLLRKRLLLATPCGERSPGQLSQLLRACDSCLGRGDAKAPLGGRCGRCRLSASVPQRRGRGLCFLQEAVPAALTRLTRCPHPQLSVQPAAGTDIKLPQCPHAWVPWPGRPTERSGNGPAWAEVALRAVPAELCWFTSPSAPTHGGPSPGDEEWASAPASLGGPLA